MTCVIGLVEDGTVYIGADSAVSDGWEVSQTARSKVWRVGDFLIGSCGSIRVSGLLEGLVVRRQYVDEDDDLYMILAFAEAVRKCLSDGGAIVKENGADRLDGRTNLIVGFNGKLYFMDTDFQIDRYAVPYCAIGIGGHFALGAMKVLENEKPVARIRKALKVAAYFSEGVRAPFVIKKLAK